MPPNPSATFIITLPTVFVYDEVWLHELVPQHARFVNFSLNLSLESSVILQHVEEGTTTTSHQQLSNNNTDTVLPTNKHSQTTSKRKFSKNSKYSYPFILSGKERWAQLRNALSNRPRGRPKKPYKVEFTEHILSRILNGKVSNHQRKVKNWLIVVGDA